MKKINLAGELLQSRKYLLINMNSMETNTTLVWLLWITAMIVLFWMMPDRKVKLIIGEFRKLLQILPLTKIAQAITAYFKSKK